MTDLSDLPEIVDSKFRIQNQRLFFKYNDHIDKNTLREWFKKKWGFRFFEIAHETGETGYAHTHVYVDFGEAIQTRNCRLFDYPEAGKNHPNIKKVLTTDHIGNIHRYLAKEDPENAHLLEKPGLVGAVHAQPDLASAMKLATKFSDACGIKAMFESRPRRGKTRPVKLWLDWQYEMEKELLEVPEYGCRKIIWIFDTVGNTGKTRFCSYMGKVHSAIKLKTFGGIRDLATVIRTELDSGKDGRIVVIDLARHAETKNWSEPLEGIIDGEMTATKYQGCSIEWDVDHVVVTANFPPPNVTEMSMDRWDIREIVRHGETLTLKKRSPNEFRVSLE